MIGSYFKCSTSQQFIFRSCYTTYTRSLPPKRSVEAWANVCIGIVKRGLLELNEIAVDLKYTQDHQVYLSIYVTFIEIYLFIYLNIFHFLNCYHNCCIINSKMIIIFTWLSICVASIKHSYLVRVDQRSGLRR